MQTVTVAELEREIQRMREELDRLRAFARRVADGDARHVVAEARRALQQTVN